MILSANPIFQAWIMIEGRRSQKNRQKPLNELFILSYYRGHNYICYRNEL